VKRLSGVRLERRGSDVVVDLLFASSGIENEVVASADLLEVLPGLTVPVATTAHLIALKVLAGRSQDLTDLGYLIPAATPADLDDAREGETGGGHACRRYRRHAWRQSRTQRLNALAFVHSVRSIQPTSTAAGSS
jgi:RimJ/RimL family protein N-acetyltransferase